MAQLVEQLLLTPEICSLNPVFGNLDLLSAVLKRLKQRKRGREWPIKKNCKMDKKSLSVWVCN